MNEEDFYFITKEVAEQNGLRYDQEIAERSGMTDMEIEDALIRVFVAQDKVASDYSPEEIDDLIILILLNSYNKMLIAEMN